MAEEGPEGSSEGLPDLALKGIEEFNRGEFYECHEYLEEAWMQESRRVISNFAAITPGASGLSTNPVMDARMSGGGCCGGGCGCG